MTEREAQPDSVRPGRCARCDTGGMKAYSGDLRLRIVAPRAHEALADAIWAALAVMTPADARDYSDHAGYQARGQLARTLP